MLGAWRRCEVVGAACIWARWASQDISISSGALLLTARSTGTQHVAPST